MTSPTDGYTIARLGAGDDEAAKRLFATMAEVFEEDHEPLGDGYVARLLARTEMWILAARLGHEIVGGLTAHTLPMTHSESYEIFIYDIAVHANHQRRGVGKLLMEHLRQLAGTGGIFDLFVPADEEDIQAIDFYRGLGGAASPVTFFTFSHRGPSDV